MLINWVAALSQLVERNGWHWTPDGKIQMNTVAQPHDTPWLYAPTRIPGSVEGGFDCGYLTILHNNVFQGRAAPSFCMECYKVVVVPQTLTDVHRMADWQQSECTEKKWACKVGAERRSYTQRKWGAYFYCRGVDEGRDRYKEVRKWVDENLEPDTKVFLKRACTEFEQHMGASDEWEKIPHQDEIEAEAREVFDYEPSGSIQSEVIQHHVYDVWDKWDEDNQPPVTYHEEGK